MASRCIYGSCVPESLAWQCGHLATGNFATVILKKHRKITIRGADASQPLDMWCECGEAWPCVHSAPSNYAIVILKNHVEITIRIADACLPFGARFGCGEAWQGVHFATGNCGTVILKKMSRLQYGARMPFSRSSCGADAWVRGHRQPRHRIPEEILRF